MARPSEEISKSNAQSGGRPDANLANDALNLGGIPAEDYATKKYVDDHMGNSEQKQKKYIDEQDQKILNEAKEYTNTQIRSQDFSGFAKATDVQALDKKLQEKITEGDNAQKNYTDQKTKTIVDDVNANFQDVNNAMSTLNGNMNELFQSVSNGKSQIAGAITDKGVPTSASDSFSTMANNISQIKTGSGGGGTPIIPEGYYDTSDATATAEDIRSGKVAYGKDGYMIGTLNPSSGIDTSNATATAEDIAYGKTAYARGQLLIGTMQSSVEEIYGVSSDPYTVKDLHGLLTNYSDGTKVKSRTLLAFTKDNTYCVSLVSLEGDSKQYIESLAVGENGFYTQSTANGQGEVTPLKYRYTMEELGIEENEQIQSICLGKNGFDDYDTECLLAISTYVNSGETGTQNRKIKVHFYTYFATDNGIIGKLSENKEFGINNFVHEITVSSQYGLTSSILSANLKSDEFILQVTRSTSSSTYLRIYNLHFGFVPSGNSFTPYIYENEYEEFKDSIHNKAYITDDDKYVVNTEPDNYGLGNCSIYKINTENNYSIENHHIVSTTNRIFVIDDYCFDCSMYSSPINLEVSKINDDLSLEKKGNIYLKFGDVSSNNVSSARYDSLNKKLFVVAYNRSTIGADLGVFNTDGITELPDQSILEAEQVSGLIYGNDGGSNIYEGNDVLVPDTNYANILCYGKEYLTRISNSVDVENIIGVIYKGKKFYSIKQGDLSAGGSDVKAGKTFIGYMGEIETGTLEVSE